MSALVPLITAAILALLYAIKQFKKGLEIKAQVEADSKVRRDRLQVLKTEADKESKEKADVVKQINDFLGDSNGNKPGGSSNGDKL